MLDRSRTCGLAAAFLVLATAGLAQNFRHLNNGGDVLFIYGPTIGAPAGSGVVDTSGDLWWLVHPRGSMIASSGTAEVTGTQFEIYDGDWTTPPVYYDVLFGPGTHANPNDPNNITPDFSTSGLAASLLLLGGPSGLPNPCTASPGFCTALGGTSTCPPSGSIVGWVVSFALGNCDGTGIVLSANNTVDNVVTGFIPGGMTWTGAPPGPCGTPDYSLMTLSSTNETQADTGTPGASRYGGFQIGLAPGFNADGVAERSVYLLEFCDSQVNTTWSGDRGTVGLHVDASFGASLKQVVHDAAGFGPQFIVFVSNCILPPLPAPGVPVFGAGLMLNLADPTVAATLKQGQVTVNPLTGAAAFTPAQAIPIATTLPFDVSSQAITLHIPTLTGRASVLTRCGINK